MNFEKLKPWNWFKHEDHSAVQIPVEKHKAKCEMQTPAESQTVFHPAATSLLQLHQEMDRLFDNVWRSFGLSSQHPYATRTPPYLVRGSLANAADGAGLGDYRAQLDVSGGDTEYEVSIDLPGLSKQDIQIEVSGNVLTVRGEKEEKSDSSDKQYYRVERSFGSFQRTLALPDDANTDDIVATMQEGVLRIRIPRKTLQEKAVKRIDVSP